MRPAATGRLRPVSMVAQLTYWSGQGTAESIRLMLAATGEEVRTRHNCFPGIPVQSLSVSRDAGKEQRR